MEWLRSHFFILSLFLPFCVLIHPISSLHFESSNADNITELPFDILTRCTAFMREFGLAASSYMECAILHSRPFQFCSKCVDHYVFAIHLYEQLKRVKVDPMSSRTCVEMISGDKIMLPSQAHKFIKDSWENAHCANCFEKVCEYSDVFNGSTNCSMANHTLVFMEYNAETMKCLQNYTDLSVPMAPTEESAGNRSVACDVCKEMYTQLNDYYITRDTFYHGGLCMDIVDAMNTTRQIWSKRLHCTHKKGDVAAIISLTGFFCLLPIVFYVSSKLHGEREEKKLLKQKRMKNVISTSTSEDGPHCSSISS